MWKSFLLPVYFKYPTGRGLNFSQSEIKGIKYQTDHPTLKEFYENIIELHSHFEYCYHYIKSENTEYD